MGDEVLSVGIIGEGAQLHHVPARLLSDSNRRGGRGIDHGNRRQRRGNRRRRRRGQDALDVDVATALLRDAEAIRGRE